MQMTSRAMAEILAALFLVDDIIGAIRRKRSPDGNLRREKNT